MQPNQFYDESRDSVYIVFNVDSILCATNDRIMAGSNLDLIPNEFQYRFRLLYTTGNHKKASGSRILVALRILQPRALGF